MGEMQTTTVKLSDLVDSVKRFIAHFFRSFKLILAIVLVTSTLALTYSFLQKPSYEGAVTFILEEKSSGMSGGLSGLASQFGFDIGSLSGSSGMFAGDNILDILKSRTIIEKVLLSKVDSSKGQSGPTLADLYLEFSHLKSKWKDAAPELANISFSNLGNANTHTLVQDSVLNVIYEKLYKKNLNADRLNKKGSIIKISTVSSNPVFSKIFTERVLSETRNLYVEVKTSVSAANVYRLQQRADSLLRVLNGKSYENAQSQLVDANTAFKSAAVPAEVSQRDKMVAYAIYTEVMKNLEVSRMALANQTPAIQVLDSSRYPLEDERKSLLLLLIIGVFAGLALGFVIVFITYPSTGKQQISA